jgi:hypothetical protein
MIRRDHGYLVDESRQCEATIKGGGRQCGNRAIVDSPFCGHHYIEIQRSQEAEERKLAHEQWMSNALDISVDAAQELTKLIKSKLEGILDQVHEVHELILEAHDRRAWQALGYPTWQQYVKKEFNLSRSRSYQLLDRARVQQALLAAGVDAAAMRGTPFEDFTSGPGPASPPRTSPPSLGEAPWKLDTPSFNMSARAVQNLKPQLPQAAADVEKMVQEGAPISHAVQTVIDQYGKPIEPEDATEEAEQPTDEQPRPHEKPVRPVGHEDKVGKFRDAVVALIELSKEDRTTLGLLFEDARYLPDGPIEPDHIRKVAGLLSKFMEAQIIRQRDALVRGE